MMSLLELSVRHELSRRGYEDHVILWKDRYVMEIRVFHDGEDIICRIPHAQNQFSKSRNPARFALTILSKIEAQVHNGVECYFKRL